MNVATAERLHHSEFCFRAGLWGRRPSELHRYEPVEPTQRAETYYPFCRLVLRLLQRVYPISRRSSRRLHQRAANPFSVLQSKCQGNRQKMSVGYYIGLWEKDRVWRCWRMTAAGSWTKTEHYNCGNIDIYY